MRILTPRLRRKGKYSYYYIEARVDNLGYHVLLNQYEWKNILMLYDAFLEVYNLLEKLAYRLLIRTELKISEVKGQLRKAIENQRFYEKEAEKNPRFKAEAEAARFSTLVLSSELKELQKDYNEIRKIVEFLKQYNRDWKVILKHDEELAKALGLLGEGERK